MLFDHIEKLDPDPILGINQDFRSDVRLNKINLSTGVYKTADLNSWVLPSVKKAEYLVNEECSNHEYLPIEGDVEYVDLLKDMIFSDEGNLFDKRIFGAQTLGGTGAIRVLADCLREWGFSKVLLSDPTWANHPQLFKRSGFDINFYPYYQSNNHSVDFKGMCQVLKNVSKKTVILLHVCCHNPTEFDLKEEEWRVIAEIIKEKELLPFFDCAYQGFAKGVEEDLFSLRYFAKSQIPFVVAYSCSKNFGLYGERVGALFIYLESEKEKVPVESQVKHSIRTFYSNPPLYGARLVKKILGDSNLKELWKKDVKVMRERIHSMREELASGLARFSKGNNYDFMQDQRGMFSYSGLSKEQVINLRQEYGIYLPLNGRMNIAGLSSSNMEYIIKAISSLD